MEGGVDTKAIKNLDFEGNENDEPKAKLYSKVQPESM